MDTVQYYIGDELDPLSIWWTGTDSTLIDYSVAYTFTGKLYAIGDSTKTNVFSVAKTTGYTGSAGSGSKGNGTPNLLIDWATSGELNSVSAAGMYVFQVVTTRSSDSKERTGEVRVLMLSR